MCKKIHVNDVYVHFFCPACNEKVDQQVSDTIEVGAAVCPECDADMEYDEYVTIRG